MNRPAFTTQKIPDRIAEVLRERVIDGSYAPGQRLTEAVIAAEFGVSHGPVRDALRLLEQSGLVTIQPYRGAQVTELSTEDVRQMYEVREALVGLRARQAARDPARETLVKDMELAVSELERLAADPAAGKDYADKAIALNRALNDRIDNPWLRGTLQSLTLQTARYTRLGLSEAQRRVESARYWRALLEAIRDGDEVRAEQVARENSRLRRDVAVQVVEEKAAQQGQSAPRKRRA
ncbi:MAG: GntR family transcriptional regulator [Burkholderiales bacterium]|nr:GntR family transcriptional regulator [Burkholderiales bacterium]